jgi:hypothetical protein
MNSFMSTQGSLGCQRSWDNNFQFSELFRLQIRGLGPAGDLQIFLFLEYVIVVMLYRKTGISFPKLYSHYKFIWHTIGLI